MGKIKSHSEQDEYIWEIIWVDHLTELFRVVIFCPSLCKAFLIIFLGIWLQNLFPEAKKY